ncbi:hypothetical protein J7L68_06520 [bacterium]|nr:hypothetical protein [bacterium]
MKHTRQIIKLILATILLFGITETVSAQPMFPDDKPSHKMMERIETLKMWKLTEALDLNEDQTTKLFPAIKQFQKKQDSLQEKMAKNIEQLENAIDNDADSLEIADIIGEINDARDTQCRNEADFYGKLQGILTIDQQAKYILFEIDFRKKMMNLIRDFHRGDKKNRRDNRWE